MAKMVYLGKDIIASLTKTTFPTGIPDFEEADINEIFVLSGITVTATQAQIVDAYNATDWADVTKPAVAHHIMLHGREWKAKDALAAGDMLVAVVSEKGQRIKTS